MKDMTDSRWGRMAAAIVLARKDSGLRTKTEDVAGFFVRTLHECYEPAYCSVFLIDEDGTNNLAEQGRNSRSGISGYSAAMPLMKHLALSRSTLSVQPGKAPEADPAFVLQDGAESIISSPVLGEAGIMGFIYISSKEEMFHKDDIMLMELAAGEIAALMTLSSLNRKLSELGIRDELTGCFNRKKFHEDIETDIPCAERYGKPLSLIKIDVDYLKLYNESNGRLRGNDILKKVSQTLAYSIRMCDKLYRYSGEEFILVLPGIDKERAVFAAGRLQKVLGQLRFEGESESQPGGKITYSMGISSFPADSGFRDGLLKTLDAALSQAKDSGGDCIIHL